jgi:hypothetical protein
MCAHCYSQAGATIFTPCADEECHSGVCGEEAYQEALSVEPQALSAWEDLGGEG